MATGEVAAQAWQVVFYVLPGSDEIDHGLKHILISDIRMPFQKMIASMLTDSFNGLAKMLL